MDVDRTELNNLAGSNRPLETDLLKQYQGWAEKTGVQDWSMVLPQLLDAWNLKSVDG